jgi:hypothetical protein
MDEKTIVQGLRRTAPPELFEEKLEDLFLLWVEKEDPFDEEYRSEMVLTYVTLRNMLRQIRSLDEVKEVAKE